jgi:hypothetical protein
VAFPRVEIEQTIEKGDVYHGNHNGRQDMKFFFDWLKKRGVKRILRVEVDDMEIPCHSDETIEHALADFHVEVLNWKRLDLDPGTVRKIGSDLREVQLYWGGGNNVLRSWSEKNEGLCMTTSLKKIILTQTMVGISYLFWFPSAFAETKKNPPPGAMDILQVTLLTYIYTAT